MSTFPRLLLRDPAIALVDLPWEAPLGDWPEDSLAFRELPVGPSRHLVRFLIADGSLYALKELPLEAGRREYMVLLRLEQAGLPAVAPAALAEVPERVVAILATEYLAHSLQYRRLLMRLPPGPSVHRDRLLDAMAFLLVDLHRNGVYWGDCSLANTLFRRDGDRIQAYLVDAETSEVHPALSDGQREYDAEILVENVAFGLADLAAMQGAPTPTSRSPPPSGSAIAIGRSGRSSTTSRSFGPATARRSGPEYEGSTTWAIPSTSRSTRARATTSSGSGCT